mmetsp:Transcript_52593/g.140807  ORF Transcript_52593/g.140807 Transcript_52593/m.140807 type:complete len:218 (-) Transcript_52593:382-1035(-)
MLGTLTPLLVDADRDELPDLGHRPGARVLLLAQCLGQVLDLDVDVELQVVARLRGFCDLARGLVKQIVDRLQRALLRLAHPLAHFFLHHLCQRLSVANIEGVSPATFRHRRGRASPARAVPGQQLAAHLINVLAPLRCLVRQIRLELPSNDEGCLGLSAVVLGGGLGAGDLLALLDVQAAQVLELPLQRGAARNALGDGVDLPLHGDELVGARVGHW